MRLQFIVNEDSASVRVGGKLQTVPSDSANFAELVSELVKKEHNEEKILFLVNPISKVLKETENTKISSKFNVKDGRRVFYGTYEVSGRLLDRLLRIIRAGQDTEPWALFLENLFQNPLFKTKPENISDLFDFLEVKQHPFTEDGCFLAFRKVRGDYKDHHSGRYDNKVGSVLQMPFEHVNTSRHETCSSGFHVCSASYLRSFGDSSSHIMIAKVNPRDVGAIPVDYQQSKMRVAKLEIVGECPGNQIPVFEGIVSDKYALTDADQPEENGTQIDLESVDDEAGIFETPDGQMWSAQKLLELVEQLGQRGLSRDTGIPRTTIQRWQAKSYKILANENVSKKRKNR